MNARSAALQQIRALQRRIGDAEFFDGLGLVASDLQFREQFRRDGGTAHCGKTLNLFEVRDRHDPGQNGDVDAGGAGAIDELEVAIIFEKQLRDQKFDARIDLALEELQVFV